MSNKSINIRSNIDNGDIIQYYAKFNIIGNDCYQPRVTMYFMDTNFVGQNKYLSVYHNDQLLFNNCGENNNTCSVFNYCFNEYRIGDMIPENDQVVIRIEKGKESGIPQGCQYSLYADITLTCDITLAPTTQPTIDPTFNPTLSPTNPTLNPIYCAGIC